MTALLTPAIDAYGLPLVVVMVALAVVSALALALDYRRWCHRCEAKAAYRRVEMRRRRAEAEARRRG